MVFGKRGGLMVLHAGIALLMLGELLVGLTAVEGQMQIVEGQTVNYVLDTREVELAFVDASDPQEDEVVAIPGSLLRPGHVIQDTPLPFQVEIVEFFVNSVRRAAQPQDTNPATVGNGLRELAVGTVPVSGTDTSGASNRAAAYVRLRDAASQQELGVWLVGLDDWFRGRAETIQVGDRTWEVSLRYRHMYKPYSMHLMDVTQDVYMGTQTAKSYSSTLRLVDAQQNVDREVRIWMNNPLRYAGETFYQSNYGRDARSGQEYTGLQVVTNTGWRIPYMACMMVAVGMLGQFTVTLRRFLRRRAEARLGTTAMAGDRKTSLAERGHRPATPRVPAALAPAAAGPSRAAWLVPVLVVVASGLWLASKALVRPPAEGAADLAAFGRLPVMYEGRIKPFDTLARNSLRILSDRQDWRDAEGNTQPAIRWLLDVITDADTAEQHRVFRIQNLELLDLLGLERRSGFRYAISEVVPRLQEFSTQVRQARQADTGQPDLFQKKVLELDRKFNHYIMLREAFRPAPLRLESLREDLTAEANRREQNAGMPLPLAVPPQTPEGKWQAYADAVFDALAQRMAAAQGVELAEPNPATLALVKVLDAYDQATQSASGAAAFDAAVQEYAGLLRSLGPREWEPWKTRFEAFFNHFSPFYYAMLLYMLAFVLGCVSWLGWSLPLGRAATWLTVLTLVVHTLALAARMYISGRPPITNLYSSALFVGWAGVLLALVLERYSRIGIANVVGAFLGFATLLVAHLMTTAVPSFKGDSFTVLVAVLDTQFWLATHVTCVTAGYSATFVAGLFGLLYVLRGVLTPSQSPVLAKETARMIYGTLCFAIFFSFFGTVLGGLWADDSWGRFWGWDPKENGALIIVLWNALVLHAYFGRLVAQRGLAILSIVGNIVTCWSWFGVNELGVGLHSYGFTEGVLKILGLIVAGHLLVIALGLVPQRWWWSPSTTS
jgi:ABC-type transport system involved in cytochrome c biogenesis permease subunit